MLHTEDTNPARRDVRRQTRKYRGITGLILAVLLAVLVSACQNNTNAGMAATDAPASVKPDSSPQPETQTVKHEYGETVVPLHPKRIAVIGLEDLTLSLDVPLVYAYGFDGYYLEDRLKEQEVTMSGSAETSPSMEEVLAAQPDLIILQKYFTDEKGYEELSKIAPTIAYTPDNWQQTITELGKILGLEDKAQSVITAYDDKLKQAKETIISAVGADKTVVYMRPSDKDLQIFFPGFAPLIYDNLGLAPDASITEFQKESPDDWGINTSLEKLPVITADYIFAIYGGSIDTAKDFADEAQAATEVETLSVWKTIPAVKQNHVFKVSARHWMSSGPIAEGQVIDDVVAALTGKQ